MKRIVMVMVALLCLTSFAQRPPLTDFQKKVSEAMKMEHRSEANRERDRNRNPVKALEFFRLKEDMKVLEFMPGGGWYTEILGPVLKEKGELYIGVKPEWVPDNFKKQLELPALSKVKMMDIGIGWNQETSLASNPSRHNIGWR